MGHNNNNNNNNNKCVVELFTFVKQRQHLCDVHGFDVEMENINFCDISGKNCVLFSIYQYSYIIIHHSF